MRLMFHLIEFLAEWKLLFVITHILSVVIGFGGASIGDMLFFKFLKDFSVSKEEASILQSIARVVLFAVVVIMLSGIALYIPRAYELSHNNGFLLKATAAVIVCLNGVLLHVYISPRLLSLSFALKSEQRLDKELLKKTIRLNRVAFASGAISVVSWYTAFLSAFLKSYMMEYSYTTLLAGYLSVMLFAILVSQIMEQVFYARGTKLADGMAPAQSS